MRYRWSWLLGMIPGVLLALPNEGKVIAGKASCRYKDPTTLVVQTEDKTILSYDTFRVEKEERLIYEQPSSESSILARVQGKDPASILGKLESNGRVFLVSSAGIYFGAESHVHVGALIASTLDIQDSDFLKGNYHFEGTSSGSIIQQGSIESTGGIALIGSSVKNQGTVVAKTGHVIFAGQESVTLDFTGEGKIVFAVTENMNPSSDYITMNPSRSREIVQGVISMEGVVVASELTMKGGVICLTAGSIDTSSSSQGGNVHISATETVEVSSNFSIFADALEEGDGGAVTIWSEGSTVYNGQISARGGKVSGNGGLVETSGKKALQVSQGKVDTSASLGEMGTWLLDPYQIVIVEGGDESLLADLKDCYNDISSYRVAPSVIEKSPSHVHLCALTEEGSIVLASPLHMEKEGVGLTFTVHEESGKISLLSDIFTKGGQIRCEGAVDFGDEGSRVLDTTFAGLEKGSSIFFDSSIDGAVDLELISGTKGSIQCTGLVGGHSPLKSLTVKKGARLVTAEDVITAGGNIYVGIPMMLKGHTKLDTTGRGSHPEGADITLLGSVNGNYKFKLDSGVNGAILIDAKEGIGSQVDLAVMQMKGSTISLHSNISASGGTIIFDGPVLIGNNLVLTDTGPTGIIFLSTLNASSSGRSLTLNAPIGRVAFTNPVGASGAFQNLTVSANLVQIENNITVTNQLLIDGNVDLTSDSTLTGTALSFTGPVNGSYNLSLDAGAAGSILLDNQVGTDTRLGTLTFVRANTITTNTIFADEIIQTTANSSIYGTMNTTGADGIVLQGGSFTFNGDIQVGGGGGFTIVNTGSMTAGADIDVTSSGGFFQNGTGTVNWKGTITTYNQDINFASNIQLTGPLSLSTGSTGAGDIAIQGTINGAYPLSLTLGAGDLTLAAALGLSTALNDVTIYSARNVTAHDIFATGITQIGGLGTSTFSGNMTATSLIGIHLTSTYLNFAGQVGGKVLKATQGDIVLNSWYSSINTLANPVVVDIFKGTVGANTGTLFVGTANIGYFLCNPHVQASCPALLGSVRSNVPCYVSYNTTNYTPADCPIPLID